MVSNNSDDGEWEVASGKKALKSNKIDYSTLNNKKNVATHQS